MAKPKSKRARTAKKVEYDSDDAQAYSKEPVPDPASDDFYHNEIDQFHEEKQRSLGALGPVDSDSDEDVREEVLAFDDDASSDDEEGMTQREMDTYRKQLKRMKQQSRKHNMGSDLEDEDGAGVDGEEMPDEKAWGNRKNQFYGADVSDIDSEDVEFSGSEPDVALLEEKEALTIQKRLIEQLDDDDYILENDSKSTSDTKDIQKVVKDISKMSTKERIKHVKNESPELCNLIEEYKEKMTEVQRLAPIVNQLTGSNLEARKSLKYIVCKYNLYINYCINLSFYVSLKCQRVLNTNAHPVIKRILQFKKVIDEFSSMAGARHERAIATALENISRGRPAAYESTATKVDRRGEGAQRKSEIQRVAKRMEASAKMKEARMKKKALAAEMDVAEERDNFVTTDEKLALSYYDMMKAGKRKSDLYDDDEGDNDDSRATAELEANSDDDQEMTADGKRAITYQIEKNKGLTPHRKKENRNPRVKNRMRYRKAKIRRKGGVRENKTEMHRYGGEATGIKAGLIKSTKFKH